MAHKWLMTEKNQINDWTKNLDESVKYFINLMFWHKLHDSNANGQDMSQDFTTPDGRRQQLCGTPTETREADSGQEPDGQTISTN